MPLSHIPLSMRDHEAYLARSDDARRAADRAPDPKLKADWEGVAQQWAKLARQAKDLPEYDRRGPEPKSWIKPQ